MKITAHCWSYDLSRGRRGPVRPEDDGKPFTPCGETEGWGWEAGQGRRSRQERGKMETVKPTSQPLGHLTASDHLASSPSPFYCCGRSSKVSGSKEGRSGEAPSPLHTQRLFFCIEFMLPSSHCVNYQEAQSRPFPTYDPGTLGPKRWKKIVYQFIALRRCCAWPLLLEN